MKTTLATVLLLASVHVYANDTYDSVTGVVNMPNVQVGSERFAVTLQHQGNLLFSVSSAVPITFPTAFSMDWLRGKTLYNVWVGDVDGQKRGKVSSFTFATNGTAYINPILNNSEQGSTTYYVDTNGYLSFTDYPNEYYVVCGSTSQYLITDFYNQGAEDGVNLFYFNEEDAKNAANLLTGDIAPCP